MYHYDALPLTAMPLLARACITKARAMPTINATRTIVAPSQEKDELFLSVSDKMLQ